MLLQGIELGVWPQMFTPNPDQKSSLLAALPPLYTKSNVTILLHRIQNLLNATVSHRIMTIRPLEEIINSQSAAEARCGVLFLLSI